jgi:hypothetical protein
MTEFSEKFVVIDLETTGLEPDTCSILEIGAVDARGRKFYRRVAMDRGRRVMWPALECNGIDALDLAEGMPVQHALCNLFMWLGSAGKSGYTGRWIMGGKNPQFDYSFLKANWPTGDIGVPLSEVISRRCVDLHSLAYGMALRSGWDMTADDFSIDNLYRSIGLEPEPKPHNALRGAIHEMEGFRRVLLGSAAAMPQREFDMWMQNMTRENIPALQNTKINYVN